MSSNRSNEDGPGDKVPAIPGINRVFPGDRAESSSDASVEEATPTMRCLARKSDEKAPILAWIKPEVLSPLLSCGPQRSCFFGPTGPHHAGFAVPACSKLEYVLLWWTKIRNLKVITTYACFVDMCKMKLINFVAYGPQFLANSLVFLRIPPTAFLIVGDSYTNSAVAMMRPPTLAQPSLGSGSLLSKPPPLGIPRPTLRVPKQPPATLEVFGVKKEWSAASTPSTWEVKGEDLQLVPWEFPLERTHREITADASIVASRISDVLRDLSVEAEFCKDPVKAKCKTTDYVCFRIRLFAGEENGQPVVVEVQRRSGSMSSFMQTCRAVLNAAEGKSIQAAKAPPPRKMPPFMKKPIGSMKCLASVIPKDQDFDAEASSALERVLTMLRSEKRDSQILGLEDLVALTDPVRTVPGVALRVSKTVILGDKSDVREEIRLLTDRDVFNCDFEDDEARSRHAEHLRHLALRVFANTMDVCSKDGCLTSALKTQAWFSNELIPTLVEELRRVETNSNNAYEASACIHSMLSCSMDLRNILADNGGIAAIEKAHEIGRMRHELLANETERCLKAVGPSAS